MDDGRKTKKQPFKLPRHPIIVGCVIAAFSLFCSSAVDWIGSLIQNRPVAIVTIADWDFPNLDTEAVLVFDDYYLDAAHKTDEPDYLNLIVSNFGSEPITDISITLPYDADFVIMRTGSEAQTLKDTRKLPSFNLNPDETISIKILDWMIAQNYSADAIKSSSSEGRLKIKYELGIRPLRLLDPVYVLLFMFFAGFSSLFYASFLTDSMQKEIAQLRQKLKANNIDY